MLQTTNSSPEQMHPLLFATVVLNYCFFFSVMLRDPDEAPPIGPAPLDGAEIIKRMEQMDNLGLVETAKKLRQEGHAAGKLIGVEVGYALGPLSILPKVTNQTIAIYVCVYIYIYIYIYMYIHTCICIYTHIYIYTHLFYIPRINSLLTSCVF